MNVPKLRFKEFTNEWNYRCLSEISTEITYGMNSASTEFDGLNKYIRITDIDDETGNFNPSNLVSPSNKLEDKFLVKKDDILFARTGASTGKTYLYNIKDGKLYFAGFLIKAHIANHNSNFIFQQTKLEKYKKWVKLTSMRSGQPGINSDEYGKYIFSITSLSEENKIAYFLSLLDKKIELQTKKIEALKLFKLSITQNIFNEKKSNDFQSVTLGKILKPGSKIPVKNTSEYEKMTVKLNFKGLAKLETKKEMADTRPFYVRNENEIIIGKQNYFNGSIAKVTKDFKGCICSNAIMSFTTINGVNVDYVLYYLSQKNYINRRKFLANGTGQKELSEKEFLKFVIKLPSTQIQNNISKKISCVSNLLLLENKKLTTLKNLKKGLLQNLFI